MGNLMERVRENNSEEELIIEKEKEFLNGVLKKVFQKGNIKKGKYNIDEVNIEVEDYEHNQDHYKITIHYGNANIYCYFNKESKDYDEIAYYININDDQIKDLNESSRIILYYQKEEKENKRISTPSKGCIEINGKEIQLKLEIRENNSDLLVYDEFNEIKKRALESGVKNPQNFFDLGVKPLKGEPNNYRT